MAISSRLFGWFKPTAIIKQEIANSRDDTKTRKKMCAMCRKEYAIELFSKNASASDGLQSSCKRCKSRYMRQYWKRKKVVVVARPEIKKAECSGLHLSVHNVPQKTVEFLAKIAEERRVKKNELYLEIIEQYIFLAKK